MSVPARVGVFVDAANVDLTAKREFNYKPDYSKILEVAERFGGIYCAHAYAAILGPTNGFEESLRGCGFRLSLKEPDNRPDGSRKADCDAEMIMDVVRKMHNLDVVVLGTGDGDFVPLVEYIREKGKPVHVVGVRMATNHRLIEAADSFIPITQSMLYVPRRYG